MNDPRYEEYLSVEDFGKLPYLGRTVNEKYSELFTQNGYYPSDDYLNHPEYARSAIILNLKLFVDEGLVEGIHYYKKVDHGIYSKDVDERPLSMHDIQIFKEILDSCTVSSSPAILEKLLHLPLKEGWTVKKATEKTIVLSNGNKAISIPVNYVCTAIDIAHNAPDIRNNDDFWEINGKYLRSKYKDAIFALLYNFTAEQFPEIPFPETAQERIDRENKAEQERQELLAAINEHHSEKAVEMLQRPEEIPNGIIDAAISNQDTLVLSFLVNKLQYRYEYKQIGKYALESGNKDLLAKLLNVAGNELNELIYIPYRAHKLDYVLMMVDKGCYLDMDYAKDTVYKTSELLQLVEHKRVGFSNKALERLYDDAGPEPIKQIIINHNFADASAFVFWLIDKQNDELIDLAVENGIQIAIQSYSNEETKAVKLFKQSDSLWKQVKKLFKNDISYSACFSEKNMKLLEYLVARYPVSENTIREAITRKYDPVPDEMLLFLLQHWDTSINDYPEKETPLCLYALGIKNHSAFKLFFQKYNPRMHDCTLRQKVFSAMIRGHQSPEKAKILVDVCHFPEMLVTSVQLGSIPSDIKRDPIFTISDGVLTRFDANGCSDITIPPSAKSVDRCVFRGEEIEKITASEGVIEFEDLSFSKCNSIKQFCISSTVRELPMSSLRDELQGLREIRVDEDNELFSSYDGVLYNKAKTKLIRCPQSFCESVFVVPDSVRAIGENAFYGCRNLYEIRLPEHELEIGNFAFAYCGRLKKINLPSNAVSIPYGIFLMSAIENVVLPATLKVIGGSAFRCSELKEIQLPNGIQKIGAYAFEPCHLSEIRIPKSVNTPISEDTFSSAEIELEIELVPDGFLLFGTDTKALAAFTYARSRKNKPLVDEDYIELIENKTLLKKHFVFVAFLRAFIYGSELSPVIKEWYVGVVKSQKKRLLVYLASHNYEDYINELLKNKLTTNKEVAAIRGKE